MLYAAAAIMAKSSFVGAGGHAQNAVSMWTSIQPSSSDVPARGLLTADVTISVQPRAAPGEQYGVIWAETRTGPVGGGIIQVSRVGIRVFLAVGAGGLAPANFSIGSLSAQRSPVGQTTVRTSVHNSGGWPLDMTGTLRLTEGPGGLSAGPLSVPLETTLPVGQSETVAVALNRSISPGSWHLRMVLHSDGLQRSAESTITLPGASHDHGWLVPVVVLVVVLLGLAALLVDWRVGRRGLRYRLSPRRSV